MAHVYILWGQSVEPGTQPTRYDFPTQAELDAFLTGVDLACGWMDYTARKPEDDCPCTNEGGEECTRKAGHEGECEFPKEEE